MSYLETVYLDTIDWFAFENLCAKIFERLQWGKVVSKPFDFHKYSLKKLREWL